MLFVHLSHIVRLRMNWSTNLRLSDGSPMESARQAEEQKPQSPWVKLSLRRYMQELP